MNIRTSIIGALAMAAALASGMAQARGGDEVQWSVTIGTPVGVPVYRQPYPVYTPVYTQPAPVVVHQPYVRGGYREPTRWDRDGDGVPNRYDRVHNPRWDRDGDGVPNRYDRHPGYADGYGRRDRDHDGIPNWRDNRDDGYWGRR